MQLSRRHVIWAPLFVIGLALSYALFEDLRTEPCPQERAGRPAANLLTGAFALYFFAGYGLMVTRRHLVMAIVTLWAWQILVLSPVLAPSGCAEAASRDRLGQLTGFAFGSAVLAVVLLGAVTSVATHLRFRRIVRWSESQQRTALVSLAALAALCFGILATGAGVLVPRFRESFKDFGADLPLPTLLLLEYGWLLWLAFAACVGLVAYAIARRERTGRQLEIELNLGLTMLGGANVALSASLLAAYLPVISMCRCL